MGVKIAMTCLHWSQPSVSSSHVFTSSAISIPTWKRLNSMRVFKFRSTEMLKRRARAITRCSGSDTFDSFSDEEFSKKIQDLALRFQLSGEKKLVADSSEEAECEGMFFENFKVFDRVEPPDWDGSIERKANSVELPFSLRIIKRKKKQWEVGFREAGESAYCSVEKAFSNMVFIIQELHSYTLQMREVLFYEDLQGVLVRVQKEMHASFVWLFQQVFSHTPTLMVYVMILLANYSVHSMTGGAATPPRLHASSAGVEAVFVMEDHQSNNVKPIKFDSSSVKAFSVSTSSGGGGGKYRPTASGTYDDGAFNSRISTNYDRSIIGEESVSGQVAREEEELRLWNSIEDEASRMQSRDEALDRETVLGFVSPIHARIESDDYTDYFRTELLYQTRLAQEPNNSLLLVNYAQFLFLVAQDYDRAEEYFKRAASMEPKDADALNKYATFLWQARNDLWAAEQTYQAAMDVEPNNSFFAANYAHFLWNTGADDTCFPLDTPEADNCE